jgi:hypothetical protein
MLFKNLEHRLDFDEVNLYRLACENAQVIQSFIWWLIQFKP